MAEAYINRIATAVPPHEVHTAFVDYARAKLIGSGRNAVLFQRMVERSGIARRYSCLSPDPDCPPDAVSARDFYLGAHFPTTDERMRVFRAEAPALAQSAVERLLPARERNRITHLLITCCTGFSAPGLDFEIMDRCSVPRTAERTTVGFMGCYAAVNALKLARHIVRSEVKARVLTVNLELCTLHLQDTVDLEQVLSFLIFADGCAASLISAEPEGLAITRFHAAAIPASRELITWNIGDTGFDMVLSGKVPGLLRTALPRCIDEVLDGTPPEMVRLWAVHPGGRSILDAVEQALSLPASALSASRDVLYRFGNMSSATVMFVLEQMLKQGKPGELGCAMAFGPGVVAETMLFEHVGAPAPAARHHATVL
ncbi:MAG TPA: type III polyketide synthase [Micropepsaceae bacterium]|nr:type III polyketide synthase [Micropepsaceae bacterium]